MGAHPVADRDDGRDPLEAMAEEFLERRRRGERLAPGEFLARFPDRAAEARELLSALILVEELKPEPDATVSPAVRGAALTGGRSFDRLGDYRILREIGRGGMGLVYEAEQESLGRRVALKVLAPWAMPGAPQIQRFLREARSAAGLHHPHIVPIFGVGEHDGLHYYAMQFIRGLGLDQVLDEVRYLRQPWGVGRGAAEPVRSGDDSTTVVDRASAVADPGTSPAWCEPDEPCRPDLGPRRPDALSVPLPGYSDPPSAHDPASRFARSVARIGIDVAEALQHAHEQGMLHRDIKPSNLLLDGRGQVWVTDFGLAKATGDGDLTRTGDLVGTLRYMAPERFRGRCDARSDVYALGLTLYEMLALRPAFSAPDRQRLIHQITQSEPPPLRRFAPGLPRDLETIIHTAIARDPGDRYPSAGALAQDLRRWLAQEPIRARPIGVAERSIKWARRNPALASLVAVSLLAAATIVVLLSAGYVRVKNSLHRERRTSYFHRIALAERAWSGNDVGRAEELLDDTPPEFRGWEWHYLKRLCHADLLTLQAHAGLEPNALAFHPDGRVLATSGDAGRIALWDLASGRPVRSLPGHAGGTLGLAFSPDGTRLASAGADRTARLWEVATGRMLSSVPAGTSREALSVAFSPDGTQLASCSGPFWETLDRGSRDGDLTLWEAATGRPIRALRGHAGSVHQAVFDPQGRRLASAGGDGNVKIWDLATGTVVLDLKAHADVVKGVAYRPDGRRLASAGLDGTLRVWDPATGEPVLTVHAPDEQFLAVAFSPDGTRLAAAGRSWAVSVWDATTGRKQETYRGHDREVVGVAFSPDGHLLASAGFDGLVRLWDASRGQEALTLRGFPEAVGAVAFDPLGRRLATAAAAGPARVWDLATGYPGPDLHASAGPHSSVAFHPDGVRLAAGSRGSGIVEVWDVASGRRLHAFDGRSGPVATVAFSPDGRLLASGGTDGTVRIWDMASGQSRTTLRAGPQPVTALAFRPDGRHLAASTGDRRRITAPGAVTVWDVATGRSVRTLRGHRGGISDLAYSPDGRLLATASWDRTVGLWDASSGARRRTFSIRGLLVWAVAFSPDGLRLVAVDNIGRMTLWDAESGHEVLTLRAHADRIYDLAFSADGHLLASASRDRTARVRSACPPAAGGPHD